MAGISKVTYGDEVLLDLTQDTVNPNVLLSGFTAHAANGDPIGGALVLGALAYLNSISYNSNYLTDKPELPKFGEFATYNKLSYLSEKLIDKPKFGNLAFANTVNYNTQVTEKPVFGDLAFQDSLSYESDQLTNKPIPYAELLSNIAAVYPNMPKGMKTIISIASGSMRMDDILYYENSGVYVKDEYQNWFSYNENTNGIVLTIKEDLTDFVKPILSDFAYYDKLSYLSDRLIDKPKFGDLAFKNTVDYETQISGKPVFGDLAFQDSISYESDQLTDKPTPADEIIRSIMDIYPDIPVGISSVILASSGHTLYAGNSTFVYQDNGIVFNSSNTEGVTAVYNSSGVLLGFSPLQFIEDAPDDGKLYARRHGEWVEITI